MTEQLEGLPILDIAGMHELEKRSITVNAPSFNLMLRAGRTIGEAAVKMYPKAEFLILAGPGNNGGDGFIAAQFLLEKGKEVALFSTSLREIYKGDALKALETCHAPLVSLDTLQKKLADGNLVLIDALFGIGLARPLTGEYETLVEEINQSGHPIIAIDIPSGIQADNGSVMGIAVKAKHTITFAAPKPGHILYPGRSFCGDLQIADIGLGPVASPFQVNAKQKLPFSKTYHKYQKGYCLVLGSADMPGAAMLAAKAARRVGCGIVAVAAPESTKNLQLAYQPGLIFKSTANANEFKDHIQDSRIDALILGCGLDEYYRTYLDKALEKRIPLVVDGGAIQEGQPFLNDNVIMTPHEGEFARAFPTITSESKLERALSAAKQRNAIIVLKGPDTIIAAPDGQARININGGPELATAGSGDILAGIIGGLLSQKLSPFEAASFGVWLHGAAGASFGQGLIAEDLPNLLSSLLKEIS